MTKPIENAVVISDLHIGCQFALCPKKIRLDGGGVYTRSKAQEWIGERWTEFHDEWVPRVLRRKPAVLIVNGDILDYRHHRATTHWSENLQDCRNAALELLQPIVGRYRRLFVIRGTEAHSGPAGEEEEGIAQALGAVPDADGKYARNELWIRIGKGLVHVLHHIGTTGSASYESTAVMRELADEYHEAGRNREEPPNIIVRSHRHRHIEVRVPTTDGYGISFTTAGWQLKTPFVWRIPGGRLAAPQVGGSLIRQGDEELHTRHKYWSLPRRAPEIVEA